MPISWTVVSKPLVGTGITLGWSPEGELSKIGDYKVLATLAVLDYSFTDVNAFADVVLQLRPPATTRETVTLPAGPAVLLKYQFQSPGHPAEVVAEALFIHGARSYALAVRSPVTSVDAMAPTFNEILRRFQLA